MHSLQIQSECKIKHKTKINLYQTPTHTFLNTFFIIKYISISSLFGSGSFSIYITNLNDNLEPPSVQNNERSACKHVLNYDEGWMLCVTSFFFMRLHFMLECQAAGTSSASAFHVLLLLTLGGSRWWVAWLNACHLLETHRLRLASGFCLAQSPNIVDRWGVKELIETIHLSLCLSLSLSAFQSNVGCCGMSRKTFVWDLHTMPQSICHPILPLFPM